MTVQYHYNNCAGDVRGADLCPEEDQLHYTCEIISLIVPQTYDLAEYTEIITKAPSYVIERISAIQKFGCEERVEITR